MGGLRLIPGVEKGLAVRIVSQTPDTLLVEPSYRPAHYAPEGSLEAASDGYYPHLDVLHHRSGGGRSAAFLHFLSRRKNREAAKDALLD